MTTSKNNENTTSHKFLILFIVGFLMTLIGIIILMVATMLYIEGSTNIDVIIFIGPIPIVIGVGPQAWLMILFSIILAVLSIIMFWIMRRKGSEEKSLG